MKAIQRTPEQNEVVEQLAMDIHRHYRAAFKALHTGRNVPGQVGLPHNCIHEHDHGWTTCHNKKYFRQRAARELRGKL
jgi:hypothetical protein